MNVFIVYAHPEPRSLNGSLKDFAVSVLIKAGHQVQVSDLYAMKFKPGLEGDTTIHQRMARGRGQSHRQPLLGGKFA